MALVRIYQRLYTITSLDVNIKHYIPPEDWPLNSPNFSDWERLEPYGNSCLCRSWVSSVTASIEAPFPKSMEIDFSVSTSKSYWFDASQTDSSQQEQKRHHYILTVVQCTWTVSSLSLTFINLLLCNFNGGVIINEYCKCCIITTTVKFYMKSFTEYTYRKM